MQTPEEFLGALEMAYADANRDRDACPSGTRIIINRGAQAAAALIRARDAEVRAEARAETLAGFTEEWGVDLTPQPGVPDLGPPRPTDERQARQEHAVNQEWFDEGDEVWCSAYAKSTLVRRLVGPWQPVPQVEP